MFNLTRRFANAHVYFNAPDDTGGTAPPDNGTVKTASSEESAYKTALEFAEQQIAELKRTSELELERERQRASEAEDRATRWELEDMKRKIATEIGLAHDAILFMTGEDEAALRVQAEKLQALIPRIAPVQAGSQTQPASRQTPSLDEQITAAQLAGRTAEAITLKRFQVFGK